MAGRIPQDFIDDLVNRVDLSEVIGNRITLKKAGREYKGCCPFHNEKTPSFTVSPDKGFYHCFGCGAHGNAIGFLIEHDKMDYVEAIEELASLVGADVPRETNNNSAPQGPSNAPLYELLTRVAQFYQQQLKEASQAVEYLKSRGLDGTTAQRFMIGFAPPGWDNLAKHLGDASTTREQLLSTGMLIRKEERVYDRFRERVQFPIRDSRGRVIGFGGRTMDGSEPKYLNSPETPIFHKGRELYGLYEAKQALRNIDSLLVVEGYMDVISLSQHGVHNAVATLGTATTPEHLKRIFRITQEVIFCFDGDRAGRQAAWRALQVSLPEMRDGRQIRFLFLPEGEDPDTIVKTEGSIGIQRRLDDSLPLSDYMLRELGEQTDMSSMDGRARLAELAKPLLRQLPDGVYRDLLSRKIAAEVGLDSDRLNQHLGESADVPAATYSHNVKKPASTGKVTPVRHAVRVILHYCQDLKDIRIPEGLADVDQPGVPLLLELLTALQSQTGLNAGALIQRFHERPERAALEKLQGLPIPALQDASQELNDTLERIIHSMNDQRLRLLTLKAEAGLDADEMAELRELHRWKADAGRARAQN
jgi:DNA primase